MNILYLNHYAGSPLLGMEYRPYYLAREWVRAGHRVQMLAADFSHVRSTQPAAGDAVIDGIDYRFYATPRYAGNGVARVKNIAAFSTRGVGRHTASRARLQSQCGHRIQHLSDGHLGRAAHGPAVPRQAGV